MGSLVRMVWTLVFLCLVASKSTTANDHPGWKTLFSTNLNEYENVAISWENPSAVPDWLTGTYVKNGPARLSFGGETKYGSLMDGWAKINKFNIDNKGVNMSSRFLKTPVYKKCEEKGDIVPHVTLGPVIPDTWGITDLPEIGRNLPDNTAVTVTRMGEEYIASTDLPNVNILNITTLEFKEIYDPGFGSTASCSHWRREPGTDNMLNIHITGVPGVLEYLHLYRYPGGDLRNPQEVGSFHLPHSTMIHMFSVTENYAIIFVYPLGVNSVCMVTHLLHNIMACLEWFGDKLTTDIYVMSLKTGEVVSHTKTQGSYSAHHVNAFEKDDDGVEMVVVDIIETEWDALATIFDLDTLLNWKDSGDMNSNGNATRYMIDIQNDKISAAQYWDNDSPSAQPYYNQFDFPVINPEYEGRSYCYVYGQAMVQFYRQYLIKKNICDSTQDKVWYKENQYNAEPYFIPRPGSTVEDDGVLLVLVLDGSTEQSYLLLLDGITFDTLTVAWLPDYIPFTTHGNWFPDIL